MSLSDPNKAADGEPTVSAIIISYEPGSLLSKCVESLSTQSVHMQVIVVDNGSTDGSVSELIEQFPHVEVVKPTRNLGFAGGANAGAAKALGRVLLFLNPDVELSPGCISELVEELEDPTVGVAGPVLSVLASESTEYGATIDPLGYPVPLLEPDSLPLYVPGCALATSRETFSRVGGFDERFFMFVEDVDYCLRVLLCGMDIRVRRGATATHIGGATAPGGYLTGSGLETSTLRVSLRERNTLAALIKSLRLPTLAVVLPLYILQSLATALIVALNGATETSRRILAGLAWNASQLPVTLRLRKLAQARRVATDTIVLRRLHRGLRKLQLLRQHGLPRIHES